MRARRVLRLVSQQARHETLPQDKASDHPLLRARRGLDVVLHRRTGGRAMILVTGASGKVGVELTKCLSSMGSPFRACFRSPARAEEAKTAGGEAVTLDYARRETLAPALEGVETIFLLSPPDSTALEEAVIGAAKKAGVQRIVKLSVWGAETGAFAFARAHRAIEEKVEASGIPHTFLRPTGYMQTYLLFAP